MNAKESTLLQKLTLDMAEIKLVLVGNKDMGIKGLYQAQEADEAWKVESDKRYTEISQALADIQKNQHDMLKTQTSNSDRLTAIEEPLKVLKVILRVGKKIKTKSVVIWGSVAAAGTFIGKFWDSLVSIFHTGGHQ